MRSPARAGGADRCPGPGAAPPAAGAVAADLARAERGRWPAPAELASELGGSGGGVLVVEVHDDAATLVDPSVPRGELAVTVRADR